MVAWVEFGDGFFVDENIRGKPYFSIVQIWRKLCHSVKLLTPKTKPNREKKRAKAWVLVFLGVGWGERNKKKGCVCGKREFLLLGRRDSEGYRDRDREETRG